MQYDELIQKIAGDAGLKEVVESIGGLPDHELLDSLMMEFRQVAERYKCYGDYATEAKTVSVEQLADHVPDSPLVSESERSARPLFVAPIRIELPQLGIVATRPLHSLGEVQPVQNQANVREELEEVEKMIHEEIERDWNDKSGDVAGRIIRLRNSQLLLKSRLAALEDGAEPVESLDVSPSIQTSDEEPGQVIRDDDMYYLYGIIPPGAAELVSPELPVTMGVDGKNSLLCCDSEGTCVIASRLDHEMLTVAATGVLLLSKQEGMHVRAAHQRIVNQLRMRQLLIPFEVGVVTKGDSLARSLSALRDARQLFEQEEDGVIWTVRMYACDGQMADAISGKGAARRRTEGQRTKRRFDIKFLEKLLQYQKNLAREAHNVLSICSSSADILSMIGLASGTSDDWKPVLHATYTVMPENRFHFFTAVDRLTTQFSSQGVMFEVEGRSGRLSINHTPQEISA